MTIDFKTYVALPVKHRAVLVTPENVHEIADEIEDVVYVPASASEGEGLRVRAGESWTALPLGWYLCEGPGGGWYYSCMAPIHEDKYGVVE